jgi:hypothetical protein
MHTFLDRYIEQGVERGKSLGGVALLLRQIERTFGATSESVRARTVSADPETQCAWSERMLNADDVDAVLH